MSSLIFPSLFSHKETREQRRRKAVANSIPFVFFQTLKLLASTYFSTKETENTNWLPFIHPQFTQLKVYPSHSQHHIPIDNPNKTELK